MEERATSHKESLNRSISCELCPKAKLLDGSSLQIITYGFVAPPIIIMTLVTNFFVCLVLLKRTMRNQTSVILVALAISDSLTGLLPLPFFVYFYTAGYYRLHLPYVPYGICSAYVAFKELLPTMSHTCSIWLTVTLALQRYFCVCRPSGTNTLRIGKTVRVIVVVFFMSVAIHLCRFAEFTYVPVPYRQTLNGVQIDPSPDVHAANSTTHASQSGDRLACFRVPWLFYGRHKTVYFYVYYLLLRAVFIHILPCILLVAMNYILVMAMRRARERRVKLLKSKVHGGSNNLCEGQASTLMLVIVVGCFLLVEFPLAVLFILLIVSSFFKIAVRASIRRN